MINQAIQLKKFSASGSTKSLNYMLCNQIALYNIHIDQQLWNFLWIHKQIFCLRLWNWKEGSTSQSPCREHSSIQESLSNSARFKSTIGLAATIPCSCQRRYLHHCLKPPQACEKLTYFYANWAKPNRYVILECFQKLSVQSPNFTQIDPKHVLQL